MTHEHTQDIRLEEVEAELERRHAKAGRP